MCNLAYVTSLIYKSGHVYNHMSNLDIYIYMCVCVCVCVCTVR